MNNIHATNKVTDYRYIKIKDISSQASGPINLIGVITTFKQGNARTGQRCLFLKLTDDSINTEDGTFPIMLFDDGESELPPVRSAGELICFHGLKVGSHGGKPQGQKRKGYSWLWFGGSSLEKEKSTSMHPNFTIGLEGTRICQHLQGISDDLKSAEHIVQLCTLPLNSKAISFYAQLIGVYYCCDYHGNDSAVAIVWDGTEPCYAVKTLRTSGDHHLKQDPELMENARGVLAHVYLFGEHASYISTIPPGSYVKLISVHCQDATSQCFNAENDADLEPWVMLTIHDKRDGGRGVHKLERFHDGYDTLKERLENYKQASYHTHNISTGISKADTTLTLEPDKSSISLTEVDNTSSLSQNVQKPAASLPRVATTLISNQQPHISSTSLSNVDVSLISDIKQCRRTSSKLKCRVALVDFFPRDPMKMVWCFCSTCNKMLWCHGNLLSKHDAISAHKPTNKCQISDVLLLALTFRDQSGSIQAILSTKNADEFFKAILTSDAIDDVEKKAIEVKTFLDLLTKAPDTELEICLRLFYAQQSGRVTIRYEIYATKLEGDAVGFLGLVEPHSSDKNRDRN